MLQMIKSNTNSFITCEVENLNLNFKYWNTISNVSVLPTTHDELASIKWKLKAGFH